MKKILFRFITMLIALVSIGTQAESLSSYVGTCKKTLGFSDSDIPKDLNCNNAVLFGPSVPASVADHQTQTNDYVGHARITDDVDLVFACRWLQNGQFPGAFTSGDQTFPTSEFVPPFVVAASIEMLIHKRSTGDTCYFEARQQTMPVPGGTRGKAASVNIVSPTVAAAAASGSVEANYWYAPSELDSNLPCADCHVAGPYIATPRIAPVLAQFGLLNDGHDTHGLASDGSGNYHAVGSTFSHFNDMLVSSNGKNGCTKGCHNIAYGAPAVGVARAAGDLLIPAITQVIDSNGVESGNISVTTSGVMPPTNDPYSDYRWINRDTPNGSGEFELLKDMKNEYPNLVCDNATELQAHVVGSTDVFSTADAIPDHLHTFNLQDGLECRNGEQSSGLCHDWQVHYMCNGTWTTWINNDSPAGNGDYERRTDPGYKNLCASPTEMQARTSVTNWVVVRQSNGVPILGPVTSTVIFTAPNDRLYGFDPQYGLGCHNADQPSGQCSNYVVRFICQ